MNSAIPLILSWTYREHGTYFGSSITSSSLLSYSFQYEEITEWNLAVHYIRRSGEEPFCTRIIHLGTVLSKTKKTNGLSEGLNNMIKYSRVSTLISAISKLSRRESCSPVINGTFSEPIFVLRQEKNEKKIVYDSIFQAT